MTRQHNGFQEATPFSAWLRALPAPLDSRTCVAHNLDYVWHNYRDGWLLTIEEKRFGGQSDRSQQDTHNTVAQLLRVASGTVVETLRGPRPIHYHGHYVVRFENTTPDDGALWINGAPSARDDVIALLRGQVAA